MEVRKVAPAALAHLALRVAEPVPLDVVLASPFGRSLLGALGRVPAYRDVLDAGGYVLMPDPAAGTGAFGYLDAATLAVLEAAEA